MKKYKTNTAALNAKTLKSAYNLGQPWSDDDVSILIGAIEKDETSFDMALRLGRTLYGTQHARSHVAFAMRHASVLVPVLKRVK